MADVNSTTPGSTGMGAADWNQYLQMLMSTQGGASPYTSALSMGMKFNPYVSAATAALGTVQTIVGLTGLNKKAPEFSLTPGMQKSISEANNMRGMGFTAPEMASAENSIARGENTGYQHAVDQAPGLASVIQAGLNYSNTQAKLGLAAKDAALHRENIHYADAMNQEEQRIQNMNTQAKLSAWNRGQQAYGEAVKSGLNNVIYGAGALTSGLQNKTGDKNKNVNTAGAGDIINYGMDSYNYG